jgi:hypothetical protein
MSDGIFKKAGKTTKDIAKKAAQDVAREPFEIIKSTPAQIVKQQNTDEGPSAIEQVMTGDGKLKEVTKIEEKQLESEKMNRLKKLEDELALLRRQRMKKEEEWKKEQEEVMGKGSEQKEEEFIEPTTKPKVGMRHPQKKKQGTREMGKGPSG